MTRRRVDQGHIITSLQIPNSGEIAKAVRMRPSRKAFDLAAADTEIELIAKA